MEKREPLTVSVIDAAQLLGISRAFAYELVARGELPSVRLGRRVVIPRKALEALVEASGVSEWSALAHEDVGPVGQVADDDEVRTARELNVADGPERRVGQHALHRGRILEHRVGENPCSGARARVR